ncbi:hypothetical protein PIN31009_00079 [Pandoraea iniqua]|uniref:Lipoprotein n=1 Tax=Pandoraea iniqua TaxID=2508288 RepID=A0A5E4RMP5_9BURK|nr:hypothetical protein [Pandoraea iniqua]VVD60597.1 hypothetical protein PIN31009_00079 [Pandoraea iniqua]VVD64606.1 hypothetical protein PIN31115_00270 [Pandoraea iniqua]
MKRIPVVLGFVAVAAALASSSAFAWRGGVRVWVGPGYYPYAYPYPYYSAPYYSPPVVVVPSQPQQYVEQPQAAAQPGQPGTDSDTWYYCDKAGAYYPYVKTCPAGWREVPAQPAN